ncbi:MAG: PAS domain S-box protein [Geminicoccaceae bacterium]|nr:PAS domain S-box protein [Geminicoccaceae bacterium]
MEGEGRSTRRDADQVGGGGSPASEALLQAIIETSPDGLITIDASGRIRSFNPAAARMFGRTADEVVGRNVACLMPEPYASEHDLYLERYLRTGERRIIGIGREVLGARANGESFPMELAVCEVETVGERRFAGFVRDVSERREADRRLSELQREFLQVSRLSAMGEMASALAHELNQPLTAVTNYAQAARRLGDADPPDWARIQGLLEKTVQQAARAGQIIHRLRQFLAKGETERRLEDVNRTIREASDLALVGVAGQGIAVSYDLADDLPPVLIDRIQMHQVLTNLLRNSVDALTGGDLGERRIRLTTRLRQRTILIEVADTGPGLAPEVAERLFQPFVTTKSNGMGIGLSICRSIVDAHHGRLWASAGPRGGTVFSIELPADASDGQRAA